MSLNIYWNTLTRSTEEEEEEGNQPSSSSHNDNNNNDRRHLDDDFPKAITLYCSYVWTNIWNGKFNCGFHFANRFIGWGRRRKQWKGTPSQHRLLFSICIYRLHFIFNVLEDTFYWIKIKKFWRVFSSFTSVLLSSVWNWQHYIFSVHLAIPLSNFSEFLVTFLPSPVVENFSLYWFNFMLCGFVLPRESRAFQSLRFQFW